MVKPRKTTRKIWHRIWCYVRDHNREHGYGPNMREVAEHLGLSSASNAKYHIDTMIAEGLLNGSNDSRSLNVNAGIPIVGAVAAGRTTFELAAASWDRISEFDTIDFPDWITADAQNPFALRITTDDLQSAGIMANDVIILAPTPTANDGDMVVAHLKQRDEHTIQRFRRAGDTVTLQSYDRELEPTVLPATDVSIEGRVIAVIRRY